MYRRQYGLPKALAEAARRSDDQPCTEALLGRALYPDLRHRSPGPLLESLVYCSIRPAGGCFSGRCYIDGSGLNPQDEVLCRAGWAIVQVDSWGNVLADARGNLPGILQHSGLGELYAFLMLLGLCAPPITVVTDYKDLVDGLSAGRNVCTAANRKGADVWRLIWDKVDDIGLNFIDIIKIKSHMSKASVLDGSAGCSLQDWEGNKAADSSAKKGAAMHPVLTKMPEMAASGRCVAPILGAYRHSGKQEC